MLTARTAQLAEELQALYQTRDDLPFHGWHHIEFVAKKAVQFATELPGANPEYVEGAALTHDLNYLVTPNSKPEAGWELREQYLIDAGFSVLGEIARIDEIVMEANTATRTADISPSAQALSDGDTLFKVLPVTPVILSGNFAIENDINLKKLAQKIVDEQQPLIDQGTYFYTESAKRQALGWAALNLRLWNNMIAFYDDPELEDFRKEVDKLMASARTQGKAPKL